MRLRWKLLILLLVLAVLPIAVVRTVDVVALRTLGFALAGEARGQLEAEVQRGLEGAVADSTMLMEQEERLCKVLLAQQAEAVERRLAGPMPQGVPRIYTLDDFNHRPGSVPRLRPSERHQRKAAGGGLVPVDVSYDAQVVARLPQEGDGVVGASVPDASQEEALREVEYKLAGLVDDYRKVYEQFPDAVFWQYTTLRQGLHVSYPGKGGYPPGYDPFGKAWYRRAVREMNAGWTPPVLDTVTGQTILTVSMPVRDASGELAGVTAIDVLLGRMLGRQRLGDGWGRDAEVLMVRAVRAEESQVQGAVGVPGRGDTLAVVASSDPALNPRRVQQAFEFQRLAFDDPADERAVFEAIAHNRKGTRNAQVDGREMKLSWAKLGEEFPMAVLVMAPLDRLDAGGQALQDRIAAEVWSAQVHSGLLVLATALLVFAAAWHGARTVTRPVADLAAASRAVADGNLDAYVNMKRNHRRDELGDMARVFNDMMPKLRDRMYMRTELDLAMEVQQALLPQEPPTLPGFDIAGRSDYCDQTGGDYYDFLEFDQPDGKHLGVALGDVTGHGIAAALLMCTARALLRSRADAHGSLAELFNTVNDHLAESGFHGRFMTLFYLTIEANPFNLRWVSAGQDPAIVYDPDADAFSELAGEDLPLGIEPGWEFTQESTDTLPARAVVVLGTDGIWEARSPEDTMYGKDRLREVIRTHHAATASAIVRKILADVAAFRSTREQLDDITLVVVKRTDGA